MNRRWPHRQWPVLRVPRTRGDEPVQEQAVSTLRVEFPAHAGMNRETYDESFPGLTSSPHTRG